MSTTALCAPGVIIVSGTLATSSPSRYSLNSEPFSPHHRFIVSWNVPSLRPVSHPSFDESTPLAGAVLAPSFEATSGRVTDAVAADRSPSPSAFTPATSYAWVVPSSSARTVQLVLLVSHTGSVPPASYTR